MKNIASGERIIALDGLRGVAILMVLAYHYMARFPDYYPYGDGLSAFGSFGYLGVELFFIISGFVIALTLENSSGLLRFAIKRFARLWPPMLVCSVVTFVFLHTLDTPFTEFRRVGVVGFLPSLTFISPKVWVEFVEGAKWIDGAYWSLFVEVRFYFWAAVIYRFFPKHLGVVLFGFSVLVVIVAENLPTGGISRAFKLLFFQEYMLYFAVGALAYDMWRGKRSLMRIAAIAILLLTNFYNNLGEDEFVMNSVIIAVFFALFVLFATRPQLLAPFTYKPLVWVGRRSYSLYLLHQNIGVTLIAMAATGLTLASYVAVIFLVTALMVLLAHLVFETVERRSIKVADILIRGFSKKVA